MYFTVIGICVASAALVAIAWKWWKRSQRTDTSSLTELIARANQTGIQSILKIVVGLAILLLAIGWLWPNFTAKYALQGGPTWLLFFLLATAAVIFTLGNGNDVSTLVAAALAFLAIGSAILFVLITWWWGADASRGEIEAARRQAYAAAHPPPPSPGIVPQVMTGVGTALFGSRSASPDCQIPAQDHEFKLTREKLNPDNTKCTCTYLHPHHTLRVWTLGASQAQWTDVLYDERTKSYGSMPNDVEWVAAVTAPFIGTLECH